MNQLIHTPSRELDALVATEIMGWKLVEDPTHSSLTGAMVAIKEHGVKMFMWHLRPNVFSGEKAWQPSIDIANAWEVVDKMYADGYVFLFHHNRPNAEPEIVRGIAATFYHPSTVAERSYEWARAKTAPLAICLAAREARKRETPQVDLP